MGAAVGVACLTTLFASVYLLSRVESLPAWCPFGLAVEATGLYLLGSVEEDGEKTNRSCSWNNAGWIADVGWRWSLNLLHGFAKPN